MKNRVIDEKALYLESEGTNSHIDSIYFSFENLNKIPNPSSFIIKCDNYAELMCNLLDARHVSTMKRKVIQRINITKNY